MKHSRSYRALYCVSGLAGLAGSSFSGVARADDADRAGSSEEQEGRGGHSSLDLAFDGEGAVPLMDRHFQNGNDLSGGGGFKVRLGDQFRFAGMRFTPEVGYGYDHLFATDDASTSYAWDMHRVFAGARLGFGRFIVPTVYAHAGYGWRDTGDPTVGEADGLALDFGFALDLHLIPHVGIGAHIEYASIDAQPNTPEWLALGLHADIAF
ncbi:MAG: hypothetical protein ABTD50_10310 [Polyangiaceae bacterium]